jgi:hypothetical protein
MIAGTYDDGSPKLMLAIFFIFEVLIGIYLCFSLPFKTGVDNILAIFNSALMMIFLIILFAQDESLTWSGFSEFIFLFFLTMNCLAVVVVPITALIYHWSNMGFYESSHSTRVQKIKQKKSLEQPQGSSNVGLNKVRQPKKLIL